MNIERRRKTERKKLKIWLKMGDFKWCGQNRCHENLQAKKVWAVLWWQKYWRKVISHILLKASDIGLQMYNSWPLAETDEKKTAIVWKKFEEYGKSRKHFRLAQLRLQTMRQKEAETVHHSMSSSSAEMQISRRQRDRRAHNWTTDNRNSQWRCETGVARQGRQGRKVALDEAVKIASAMKLRYIMCAKMCRLNKEDFESQNSHHFHRNTEDQRNPCKVLFKMKRNQVMMNTDLVLTCLMMTTLPGDYYCLKKKWKKHVKKNLIVQTKIYY